MNKLLFGIDGGGSNTKLLVTDIDLNKLEQSTGGATNFLKVGFEEAVINVQNLIEPFLVKYSDDSEITLVIGTAGAGRKEDAEKFETYLKESLTAVENIKVVSDAEITLRGAFENQNGAILISGTGSILYYKLNNEINRVGGFGRLIGDEGSGYSIGRKGLNVFSKMLDGRIEKTSLTELANKRLGIDSAQSLITKVYKEEFNIASFAEIVIEAAGENETHSKKIIDEETDELINHLRVITKNNKSAQIDLVLSGGLLESENIFKNLLIQKIADQLPQIKIVKPKHRPEYGAVLIAKEILQVAE